MSANSTHVIWPSVPVLELPTINCDPTIIVTSAHWLRHRNLKLVQETPVDNIICLPNNQAPEAEAFLSPMAMVTLALQCN